MSTRTKVRQASAGGAAPARTTFAPTPLGPRTGALLRRSCACDGDRAYASGECAGRTGGKAALSRGDAVRGSSPSVAPPLVHETLRSQGSPLDASTRAFMEPRFGHDFGRVRVHTDERAAASARAVGASAYTVGDQIVFAAGRYSPASDAGRRLLAHELTHVAQSRRDGAAAAARPAARLEVSQPSDPHEQEAEETASRVMSGAPLAAAGGPPAFAAKAGSSASAAEAGPYSRGVARFVPRHAASGASLYRAPAPEEEEAAGFDADAEEAVEAEAGDSEAAEMGGKVVSGRRRPPRPRPRPRQRPPCEGTISIPPSQTANFNFGVSFRFPTRQDDYICFNGMSLRAAFRNTDWDSHVGRPATYTVTLVRQRSGGAETDMRAYTNTVGAAVTRDFPNVGRGAYALYLDYAGRNNARIRGSVVLDELTGSGSRP
ncbi:MAG TPA: DUF4157 domain-containing protein [Pyrinomonadaceae bacterium]|jgi:hypothetical protein